MTGSKRWSEGLQEVPGLAGVGAGGDDALDRIARLASQVIGSEAALVALVDGDRQSFPGQHGLHAPWRDTRETPLLESIWRMVVATGEVVQIDDTAAHERTAGHEARTVLEVGQLPGGPLSDEAGDVLGTCASSTATPTPGRATSAICWLTCRLPPTPNCGAGSAITGI